MNRRIFLVLSGLSGLGLALGSHYLSSGRTLTLVSCPKRTTKLAQPLLRFVALADTGFGNDGQYAVAQAMNCYLQQNPFQFVLLAGDNIYDNGEIEKIGSAFEKPYQALLQQGIQFYAALGNHDIRTNNGEDEIRYSGFNMQGRYYTFTKEAVQFFAIDTNNNAPWKAQLDWLEENLSRSQVPWKVVFGHHPVYSSGVHGGSQQMVKRLTPLFSRYGVQLYISGHDHNYERTHRLQGTTYLVCGAGAKTRPVGSSSRTAISASRLSFATFEVYPNRLEVRGIDTNGKIFDQVAILNSAPVIN